MAQFICILFALCLYNNEKGWTDDPGKTVIKRRLTSLLSAAWPTAEFKISQGTNFWK